MKKYNQLLFSDYFISNDNNKIETRNKLITEIKIALEKEFINYYTDLMQIEFNGNSAEILLPVFLDDCTQLNIFLLFKTDEIILSSNLLYALDQSIVEETKYGKNILKDFIINKKEYSELKSAFKKKGINTDSISLEYIKKIDNNFEIFKEIIIYSELSKSFYNNLYHSLINRLSKPHEKHNIFYNNFNNIVTNVTKKVKLTRYEEKTISKNPIYTGENIILSASKDFDSLGLLYMDLLDIKEKSNKNKALIFIESEKAKDKDKLGATINRFRGSGFYIKEISENSMSDNEILEEIKRRTPNEKFI